MQLLATALLGATAVSGLTVPLGKVTIPWPRVKVNPLGIFETLPVPELVPLDFFPKTFEIKPWNEIEAIAQAASAASLQNSGSSTSSGNPTVDNIKTPSDTSDSSGSSTTASSKPSTAQGETPVNLPEGLDSNPASTGCPTPKVRPEWRSMADADKAAFVKATRCLMDTGPKSNFKGAKSRYEELVWSHQQMSATIHMVAQFLPWHRYFLHMFEVLLAEECAYDGPIPWWDETLDAGAFSKAPMFTADYFGSAPAVTASGQGTCVTNGAFAGVTLHVGPGDGFVDHCLSRAVNESLTQECNTAFVNRCASFNDYDGMASCNQYGPHAYGHNGVGAVMSDVAASPSDPIFMLHHGFVDHMWYSWQRADENNRLYQIGGNSVTTTPAVPLTLGYVLTSKGLKPDVTVKDVMDTRAEYLCYTYDY